MMGSRTSPGRSRARAPRPSARRPAPLAWAFQAELGRDGGAAVLHLGVDVLEALQRGDAVLDLAGHIVSSCVGEAPGRLTVTEMVGRSMSGKFCTFMALNAIRPPKVSSTNSISAGIGFLIDQVGHSCKCSLFASCWRLWAGAGACLAWNLRCRWPRAPDRLRSKKPAPHRPRWRQRPARR